jgi:hypothetical protein
MTGNEQRPDRTKPMQGANIINVGGVIGQDKDTQNIDTCKNNRNYLTTRERVLHALKNVKTVQDVADELGISYQAALYHINRLCEVGAATVAGYFGRKSDGRIAFHYQDADIYYRIHPEEADGFYKKYRHGNK